MKTNAQYCREKVYEAEHGKCQKCGYDAHALFKQIRYLLKCRNIVSGKEMHEMSNG